MSTSEPVSLRIAVLGATGPTGQQVVQECLEKGHRVTAVVRNPDKMTEKHEHLSVAKVNIYDEDTMVDPLRDQNAVISCLGCAVNWFNIREITFYSDTAKHIVEAMKKAGVSRFIFMSSWYTKYNRGDPFIVNWLIKPLFLGSLFHNMGVMEDNLTTNEDGIDFTSVRCPQLVNKPKSGKEILVNEDQYVPEAGYTLVRRDVAAFLLHLAVDGGYTRKCIAIGTA